MKECMAFSVLIYYKLGFHDMYNSWWFITLIGMLGTSIIIASVDRVIPLYKSLKKQRTKRHASFMKRQRIYGVGPVEDADDSLSKSRRETKELRYNVKVEDGAILAEKNRFSRWGPYVNHTGLNYFSLWRFYFEGFQDFMSMKRCGFAKGKYWQFREHRDII